MPAVNKMAGAYKNALAESPNNQELNNSLAMCYLKLKLYDKALPAFEKAMEDNFDNSETFFYAAVCLLQGKKAFLHQRPTINKIIEYMDAAIMIEPKGIYYYFWAYIRYDHHFRKAYRMSPNYQELLAQAKQAGLSPTDITQLYSVLGVERPSVM
jgi:tetratricopeptide (TPR) repeat protein